MRPHIVTCMRNHRNHHVEAEYFSIMKYTCREVLWNMFGYFWYLYNVAHFFYIFSICLHCLGNLCIPMLPLPIHRLLRCTIYVYRPIIKCAYVKSTSGSGRKLARLHPRRCKRMSRIRMKQPIFRERVRDMCTVRRCTGRWPAPGRTLATDSVLADAAIAYIYIERDRERDSETCVQ